MTRLPFNPDLIPPRKKQSDEDDAPLTVSGVATLIREALAAKTPAKVRVVGEVSNFSNRTHWFFSLKDESATLRCVCFASSARRVGCPVEDGMQVIATGRLDFFEGQGSVQLYVDSIEPVGQGALERRLRLLMEELRELGYFDGERKKRLPLVPCKVAVVTSKTGAALQDVLNTAARRWPGCRLYLVDVRVQGAAAAPEIARAIDALSRHRKRLGLDAIILTRGGGSIEDLWAFNERAVADAVFRCEVPIVAAIGHETDTTIAELVADLRCATPTQAVMTLLPDAAALEHQSLQLSRRLALMLRRSLESATHRVEAAARHDLFRRPARLITQANERLAAHERRLRLALPRRMLPERERLTNLVARLNRATPLRLKPAQERLTRLECELDNAVRRRSREAVSHVASLERQLASINPHNVLQRGYSYTLAPDGTVLKRAADATPGARLTTVLGDGRVRSVVEGQTAQALPGAPARPQRRRKATHPDQARLF